MVESGKVYLTKYGAVYLLSMVSNYLSTSVWYCLVLDSYDDPSSIGTIVKAYIHNNANKIKQF